MALSRRNGRSRATLLFLVLTSITVITLDSRDDGSGVIATIRDVAADGLAPVRDAADAVLSPVGDAFSGITGYDDLEDENARLRDQLAELRGRETRAEDAETELKELLSLNGLDWVGDIPQVAARVVGAPISNFEQTIRLNKGSGDGVAVDDPVISGDGLVGRVVDVSSRRSVVRLLTDPASAVGVRTSRASETGIASGEGPDELLSVGFIEVNADVRRRELVVTSGLEGGSSLYPSGIPVGRIAEVEKVEGGLEQRVKVRPLADLDHLRFVKVLQVGR